MSKPMIGNAVQMHMHMRAFEEAYAAVLKPLCAELSMPQSALDRSAVSGEQSGV